MGSIQEPVGKDVAWYAKDLPASFPRMRKLLEEYSGIPAKQVDEHIKRVRDAAWDVYPYGSVGMFGFLTLNMPDLPVYGEIVQRTREGAVLLDLGCCFAQELRPLLHEGAISSNLWGADLHKGFMDVGFDLFEDRSKIDTHFIAADIFDPESDLKQLDGGKVDIVHTGSFFHLFSWDDQVKAAKRVVGMLKKETPGLGSLVVGRHAGDRVAGEKSRPGKLGSRYRHNAASWERLWAQVGEETGTQWIMHTEELVDEKYFREGTQYSDWNPENTIRIQFVMRMVG